MRVNGFGRRVLRAAKLGALALAGAVSLAPAPPASAHHYVNPNPDVTPFCTRDWNAWGGDARSRSEVGVPRISVNIAGSNETGYRYEGETATPRTESHVRMVGSTLVGDVGAYRSSRAPNGINNVIVTGSASPSTGRTISNYCRFFDDPYRAEVYSSVGSREHYSGRQEDHQYVQPGNYSPWMHAVDNTGAWSVRGTDNDGLLYVNGPPTASFAYSDPARVASPVSFNAAGSHDWTEPGNANKNGTLRENGPLKYAWDLDGDGKFNQDGDRRFGSADKVTATYTYDSKSAREVKLRVTDQLGTQRVTSQALAFDNIAPRAGFSVSPELPEAGQAASFFSTSSDPDGTVSAHQWDLNGDGKHDDASGATASWVFPSAGRFPISLKITDNGGRSDTLDQVVVVAEATAGAAASLGSASSPAAAAPRATTIRRAVSARTRLGAALTRSGARLRTFTIKAERGATVRVRCAGGGCRTRAQTIRSRGKLITLRRFQRSYRAGAVIQVFVTKSGRVGRYARITIRKGRAPLRTDRCLSASGRRPTRC